MLKIGQPLTKLWAIKFRVVFMKHGVFFCDISFLFRIEPQNATFLHSIAMKAAM